jgi:membrane-associated protein
MPAISMDVTVSFILEHATHAHWAVFGLLMLAGLNFPISEDVLIIISGMLASTVAPENTWKLFSAVYLGAYISDFIPYLLGRRYGHNLWRLPWFSRMLKPNKIKQIRGYYRKFGLLTLLIGRFIPFGVRNCLFLSAGIGKMRFVKFAICDGIACLISNASLFTLAFLFGKNYSLLLKQMKFFNILLFSAFVIALITIIWYKRSKSVEKI